LGAALVARSRELDEAEFHAQVKVTNETTLLFRSVAGRREPVRRRNGGFVVGDAELSGQQLAGAIETTPEEFSPSALLRPVVQDTLLPTAAYIGGPAEVAYMAQAQVIYERLLGRMPAILPRASFTIVEPPIARFLAQYGLEVRDLFAGPQQVRAAMERKSLSGALAARFDAAEQDVRKLMEAFEEPLGRLDATLVDALRSTQSKMLHQFGQLKGKVARAESFRSGVLERHQRILLDSLYPGGGLQERTLCALPLLASCGPGLLDDLAALASLESPAGGSSCAQGHQILLP
jgi:uncharacterized protein YllA (UPF0747 family)